MLNLSKTVLSFPVSSVDRATIQLPTTNVVDAIRRVLVESAGNRLPSLEKELHSLECFLKELDQALLEGKESNDKQNFLKQMTEDTRSKKQRLFAKLAENKRRKQKKIEACSNPTAKILDNIDYHPLLAAVHSAYSRHYPLVLSPDLIWLCITQGLALHINQHAEQLRHCFVQHEGKQKITIRRDDFVKGDPNNDWEVVFDLFSAQIKNHIGNERHSLIVADFSTTGKIERAVSEIVLMAAMSCYFEYEQMTLCGIPEIQLAGTLADWQNIYHRIEKFAEFGCTAWTQALMPVIEQFIAVYQGKIDNDFWRSLYKLDDSSGGPYITGWINVLFPYIEFQGQYQPNRYAIDWTTNESFAGTTVNQFPSGLSVLPFQWNYLTTNYSMEFMGGFVGVSQQPETLALKPELGWAVSDGVMDITY